MGTRLDVPPTAEPAGRPARRRGLRPALAAVAVLAVIGLGVVLAGGDERSAAADPRLIDPSAPPFPRMFSADSPFNTPIPADAALHPESPDYVAALAGRGNPGVLLAVEAWTVPVYLADTATPRYRVRLTAPWSEHEAMLDVPIPDVAAPDPAGDAHLAVIDLDGGYLYEFWQARQVGDGWQASWGNRISLESTGVYPWGKAARGSGISVLAGVIWPHELAAGRIEHALIASYYPNRKGVVAPPATASDGDSEDPLTLPEGTRLRLDPLLDLDELGLGPIERTIAEAMQAYGIIIGDNGSSNIGIYMIHPQSFSPQPEFAFGGLDDGFAWFDGIPLDRLQVLDFQTVDLDSYRRRVADESIYER